MKDSKQVRSEYQSFVESYSSIAAKGAEEAKEVEMKKKSPKKERDDDKECSCEMVLMRKSGAFTELAERYQMSVKQFARFVEANQGLFDIETRKKAILANKFSGFKESVEWDEFFGDLELVEQMTTQTQIPPLKSSGSTGSRKPPAAPKLPAPKKPEPKVGHGTPGYQYGALEPEYKPSKKGFRIKGNVFSAEEVEELQEVQTKETASGTKYKVRVKEKDTGSSYIRYATREKIAQLRADPKIASVEMTDEGEAPEDKGEKKAQEKGGGLAVKAKKMKEKKEREAAAPAKPQKRSVTTEAKKLDPVGEEDADIDNDGDTDKSDKYLHNRRKAIGKAMKKRGTKKESFSNWRDELRETIGGDKVPTKPQNEKKPTGPVKNKVVINPPMCEGFDPQKVAQGLGAELVDCQEVDEAVESGPILPGEKGKRIFPKGQEPKPTGAKLPPVQKAGFEPEGDQLDEAIPLAIGAGIAGAGLVGAALMRAKQATSSKNRNDSTIGKPTLQGAASAIRKRNEMLRQAGGQ